MRTFNELAAHGGAAPSARPVPPSPGRIMTSQLYRRFREMEEMRAAQQTPAVPPAGSPMALALSRASSLGGSLRA